MTEHYFTADPAAPDSLRTLHVRLADRDLHLVSAGGVFSPGHVDTGTQVLLREVPEPPASGHLLDLGCGWGPIALTLALRSPDATVWGLDVNRRALDLLRRNAEHCELTNIRPVQEDEVPGDVRFATIWSNPPIRVGKAALHEMVETWLPRLVPGGSAYLVVQKNLGSDSLHRWLQERFGPGGFEVARRATSKGFRVIEVTAPPSPVTFRPAVLADVDEAAEVYLTSRRAHLPYAPVAHPDDDVRTWVRTVLLPSGGLVVVHRQDDLVGVLATSDDGDHRWIDQLYLRPGTTGQGIGSIVLSEALDRLAPPVRLHTFQANTAARRFYQRHGFEAIEFTDGSGNEERCPDVLYEWRG